MSLPAEIAHEFALSPDLIYLNHAATGPWPQRAVTAWTAFARLNMRQGCLDVAPWVAAERRLRSLFQQLINAPSARDIALVKNTSDALSLIANGIDWQPGDNVVLPAEEFPSNRMMWDALRAERQVEVRHVRLADHANPEEALLAQCDPRTRLLTVSAVQYASGLRLDLERLGSGCAQAGAWFCVDAIQQLGAFPFDVQAIHADVVAAGSHKWMLAPEGVGLLYTTPQLRDRLKQAVWGWRAMANPLEPDPERWQVAVDARRFEGGSHNTGGLVAVAASVELLLDIGIDRIAAHIASWNEQLIDGLRERSVEIVTPCEPPRRAGIVAVRVPQPRRVVQRLAAVKVAAAARDGLVRFAPHLHNSVEQIERVLTALDEALETAR